MPDNKKKNDTVKSPAVISKKKSFSQSKNLVNAGYLFVLGATTYAWNSFFNGSLAEFSIPSYLGILAFGLMWMHYFAHWLKQNYEPGLDVSRSTRITQWVVLAAIIAHPVVIIMRLKERGLGLPPSSLKSGFGESMYVFIIFGAIALTALLLFEAKAYLKKKLVVWRWVLRFNDLAMVLILFHGAQLGFVTQNTFFKYIWLGYGLALFYFYYDKYIFKQRVKKFAVPLIVALFALGIALFSVLIEPGGGFDKPGGDIDNKTKSLVVGNAPVGDPDEEVPVTLADLERADGLENRLCWIAVDGKVYDASDNEQWVDGRHILSNGLASCGRDLSNVIGQSSHGKSVLGQLKVVGKLE